MKLKKHFIKNLLFPNVLQLPDLQFDGAMQDPGNAQAYDLALTNNAQSSAGGVSVSPGITESATSGTITSLGGALFRWTAGSGTTVTIDSAYNIALTLPQPLSVGQKFTFDMMSAASTTIATPTLLSTDVTLSGTTSMTSGAQVRRYQGTVTQVSTSTVMSLTAGSTFTSIAQVGSSNLFTVTLGTNAISPTVGTLMHINVTTGTLPSGWYPIVKVTSATSFIIATPAGTVWTATAGTVDTTAPSAAVYAPLITIQGLYQITASAAV